MLISETDKSDLGFTYSPCVFSTTATPDKRRACFRVRKVLEGIVYDTVALEDNPFTFPEVKTLLEGITVGGHRVSDANQVLNQAASWQELLRQVETGVFEFDAVNFKVLHALVAKEEALTWGVFRDDRVSIAGTEYAPPPHTELAAIFERGHQILLSIPDLHERAHSHVPVRRLEPVFLRRQQTDCAPDDERATSQCRPRCHLRSCPPQGGIQPGDDPVLRQPGRQ